MGKVISTNISLKKGTPKVPVEKITLIEGLGVEGDAHSGTEREVSLLSLNDVKSFGRNPGDFAENITFDGIKTEEIEIGTMLKVGETLLKVTAIGKRCHSKCAIYREMGDCIMPKRGIFAKVIEGGEVKPGDKIEILGRDQLS
ncbi:MAG: MOSC domain-containing protein [Synergistetes bacterium]|nr:MOSC domain-containing protein [Synergistota bacterium]